MAGICNGSPSSFIITTLVAPCSYITNMAPKMQLVWDVVALLSLLGLIIVIIWIHLSSPLLTSDAPLSASRLNVMSIAVAITATVYTMFLTDRIRHGLIRSLEPDLRSLTSGIDNVAKITRLERSWRAVLRIDAFKERLMYLPSLWIFLRYVATGMMTASIITVFTPRTTIKHIPYDVLIPSQGFPVFNASMPTEFLPAEDVPCAFMVDPDIDYMPAKVVYWGNPANGSCFYAINTGYPCPATEVVALIDGINSHNADEYAYVDSGIAVQRTAMGASRNIFNGPQFANLLARYGASLNSTTQCVPVMKSNPIRCEKDEKTQLEIIDDEHIVMDVDGQNEIMYFNYTNRNLTRDNVMANFLQYGWHDPLAGNQTRVGLGKAEFSGFTGEHNANRSHANDLALIMGEPDKTIGLAQNSTYTVRCSVDPRNSFEYRFVSLLLNHAPVNTNNHTGSTRIGYTRSLVGGETCTPATGAIGLTHFAAATVSLEKVMKENYSTDWYFSTIQRVASRWGRVGPPFAFPDSRNALEDALGVIAALGVSTMAADKVENSLVPEAVNNIQDSDSGQDRDGGASTIPPIAEIIVSGFSSTPLILLLVLIPPVLTLGFLLHLFLCSYRSSWQPGRGGDSHGLTTRVSKLFVAESLTSLIALGAKVTNTPKTTTAESATPELATPESATPESATPEPATPSCTNTAGGSQSDNTVITVTDTRHGTG